MKCHLCGQCCIYISISSPIPGMTGGKPGGVRCIHLNSNNLCALFGKAERPKICSSFKAEEFVCGSNGNEARDNIIWLEEFTSVAHS